MNFYINPEAECLGQINAVAMDENGKFLGATKLQNIQRGATKAEIDNMKKMALAVARNFEFI
ncbi:MAG: hypothetical protein IPK84_02745 [Candidatus Moraniibacteriota bacterium]|nr:MAG: hypothetical protein IPK84_02745 [Candidatus Moranbacteria bacterium]